MYRLTAELRLGPHWRERIARELDGNSLLTDTAQDFYNVLAALPGTPTYAEAWKAVRDKFLTSASEVRRTTAQTIFDMLWQTLSEEWSPTANAQGDTNEVPPGVSRITGLPLAA